jgi:serine/threonine-protein kinase
LVVAGGVVGYLQFSEGWAPVQTVAIPTIDRPGPSADPQLQAPTQITPPPDPVALPAPQAVPQPSADPVDKIGRFIRDYDGGDCFIALPKALSADSADIDAFGLDRRAFEAFDEAFSKTLGFEAMIDGGQVTQAQCATLRALNDLRREAQARPGRLEITRTAVRSGETLTGSLVADQQEAMLLLVDDEGRVSDVSQQLIASSSGKRFTLRLVSSHPGRAQPIILVSMTSSQPISALRNATGLTQNAVASLVKEVAGQGGGLAVAAKYFKLE